MPTPDDVRNAWQNQAKEINDVSLELIRNKAQQLEAKLRNELLLAYTAALVVFVIALYLLWQSHDVFFRIGAGLLALWALHLVHRTRRGVLRRPEDATRAGSLEFYRKVLERQCVSVPATLKLMWPALLSFALFLTPGVMAVMRNPALWSKIVPSVALMAIWLVASAITLKRKRLAVQREIEELDLLLKLK